MRYIRQLVRNGNSTQVTMPKDLLLYLRWCCGDAVAVELTARGTVEVRRATPQDLVNTRLGPMTIDPSPVAKIG
jgi:antitoxin component of MazEF toxin-antitoxin module